MLIGRTDDPQNPRRVAAFEVTNPFGGGSRNPSGPAVKVPRQTGRTHDRFSHQIKFFPHTPLHSKGRPHTSYKVGVDVGADRIMWSSAQITNYRADELVGSLVVCVCNLGAKNIAGFTSELLILGARNAEGNVIALAPRSEVAVGELVF